MNRLSLGSTVTWVSQRPVLRSSVFLLTSGVVLLILNEYLGRVRFTAPPAVSYSTYWLVITLTFAALVLGPWQRYRHDTERLMVVVFLAGLVLGLTSAAYKAYVYQELWTLFNVLAEPIRSALAGLLVAWSVGHVQGVSRFSGAV